MAETADWTTHLLRAAGAQRLLQTDALAGSHPWNASSAMVVVPLSTAVNMKRCGVNLARVLLGKESYVYHLHHREEEWIYVLSDRGIAEIVNDEFEVGPVETVGAIDGTARSSPRMSSDRATSSNSLIGDFISK